MGSQNGIEADLVNRKGIDFTAIPAAGIHGVSFRVLPGNIFKMLRGFFASRQIIRKFNPDVLFFTGGFVAVPMALASGKRPKLVYSPDIEPGLALRLLARFTKTIAVTVKETRKHFPGNKKVITTGYPVRNELSKWHRDKALKYFNLNSDSPILLFLGGSKGAHSINQVVVDSLSVLLRRFQIIHLSGSLDWQYIEKMISIMSPEQLKQYHAFPYLHDDIGAAYACADLVISRSGASILGEYPFFGLPAILIPYPHAWRYQKVNADYLVDHHAAILLEDAKLADELIPTINDLFDNPIKLSNMRLSMKSIALPNATINIARLISELSKPKILETGGNQ